MDQLISDVQALQFPVDLLIIDTQHLATVGADENSSTDAGIVLAALRAMRDALGCAILLIHHPTKEGTNDRGSGAYKAGFDFQWEITVDGEGKRTLKSVKMKDLAPFDPIAFELVPCEESLAVDWGAVVKSVKQDSLADQIEKHLRGQAGGRTAIQIAEEIGGKLLTVKSRLADLTAEGRILSSKPEGARAHEYWHPDHRQLGLSF